MRYSSYYLYRKYEKRDGQDVLPVIPTTYSIDGEGTMPKVLHLADDPNCGLIPVYRWIDMSINEGYWCDECGETSQIQYRKTASCPYCIGHDSYADVYSQVSTDYGSNFVTTATTPTLIERNADNCGTTPKLRASYSGYSDYIIDCDSTSAITSGETFYGDYTQHENMTSAYIGNCVTEIGANAFINTKLTGITIPDTVHTIGNYAFAQITTLSSITIPCEDIFSIGFRCFSRSSGLVSITLGIVDRGFATSWSIGNYAFYNCSNLTSLTIHFTNVPTIGNNTFTGADNCIIYVPDDAVNAYKTAPVWENYASRIRAIPQ